MTPTPEDKQCRDAFERELLKREPHLRLERDGDNYKNPTNQFDWEMWQAAWNHTRADAPQIADEELANELAHDMTVAFDNHHSQPVTPDQIEARLEECLFAVKHIRAATQPKPQPTPDRQAALVKLEERTEKICSLSADKRLMASTRRRDIHAEVRALYDEMKAALTAKPCDAWLPIETAPREALFVCRRKSHPHIQFEASLQYDHDIDDNGNGGWLLYNETTDNDILDDSYSAYEWQPLPAAPQADSKNGGAE